MSVSDRYDVNVSGTGVVADDAVTAFEDFVAALRAATPGYGVAAWQAAHAYSEDDLVHPIIANGHFYKCTTAGTSGASAPAFPTSGGVVGDGVGDLEWTDQGLIGTAPTGSLQHTEGTTESAEDVS